jgi:hypothetical protein
MDWLLYTLVQGSGTYVDHLANQAHVAGSPAHFGELCMNKTGLRMQVFFLFIGSELLLSIDTYSFTVSPTPTHNSTGTHVHRTTRMRQDD